MKLRMVTVGAALVLTVCSLVAGCSNKSDSSSESKPATIAALSGANPPPTTLALMAQNQANEMRMARANYMATAAKSDTVGQAAQAAKLSPSQKPPTATN